MTASLTVSSAKNRERPLKLFIYIVMFFVVFLMLFPLYWIFVTALKPAVEIFAYPPKLWPGEFHWGNFLDVLRLSDFATYFKNSFIVSSIATGITLCLNLLAGYAFAKYRFKGREFFFLIMLSTMMIPLQVTMIPNFIIVSRLGLINTYAGLILPPCAEAFGLFLSRQFLSTLPNELIESGRIDGASEFSIFLKIILPNARNLVNVLVIFTFMWRWNDFQWPLILLSNSKMYTVQLGLAMLNGTNYVNWNQLMAASLLAIVPVMAVFLIFQKRFIQGMATSGIKG
ncbi:sugar ABC transporter permease [Spirochaetia bacterium]|nr:sugar ABC transporter permease [Spirochaetia bacterium]